MILGIYIQWMDYLRSQMDIDFNFLFISFFFFLTFSSGYLSSQMDIYFKFLLFFLTLSCSLFTIVIFFCFRHDYVVQCFKFIELLIQGQISDMINAISFVKLIGKDIHNVFCKNLVQIIRLYLVQSFNVYVALFVDDFQSFMYV